MQGMVIYCERAGDGLWAEPLNALTSLAFVPAALAVLRLFRSRPEDPAGRSWDIGALAVLVFLIGIGSFLWHTLATSWSEWADVIPLLVFMNLYLVVFLYRVAGLGSGAVLALLLSFQGAMVATGNLFPPAFVNGSMFYVPSLVVLWLLAVLAVVKCRLRAWPFAVAAALFSVSLTLRSVDLSLCPQMPTGSHFLWHLLNAAVLYLVLRGLLAVRPLRRAVATHGAASEQ